MSEILKGGERQEGWKDETNERSSSLQSFLPGALRREFTDRYSDSELNFSGASPEFQEVQRGTIPPTLVRVLYQGGEIKKVHAVYVSKRGNLDAYISGRVLNDFLEKK